MENKNYIIYGVIGVVVLIGIVMLFSGSKNSNGDSDHTRKSGVVVA